MKVAVCLVVKNESIEIIYWIAWYKALGFDSFIIYDDFSSDNTENVILSLKNTVDIRYTRNAENYDMHSIRQLRIYNHVVDKYQDEFDWIALFDADEYLDLDGVNIKEYLYKFEENISCIAFNWCCVGTNGFINRPEGPPFLNYTKHGRNELPWNRHTKVIFRPKTLQRNIYYVHNVMVLGDCVASDGQPIQWNSADGGFTQNPPSWKEGRLLHYQSRSIEHYVKRHVDLEAVRFHPEDPLHHITNNSEYNEVESSLNDHQIQSYYLVMNSLISGQINYIIEKLVSTSSDFIDLLKCKLSLPQVDIFDPVYLPAQHEVDLQWISFNNKPGGLFKSIDNQDIFVFKITNMFGKKLGIKNHKLSVSENLDADIVGIYIKNSNYIHLLSINNQCFHIQDDVRISKVYTYLVWSNEDNSFSLSHPRKKKYMSITPDGVQSVNKARAFGWEKFNYHLMNEVDIPTNILEIAQILSIVKDVQTIKEHYLMYGQKYKDIYLNIINSLPKNEFDTINLISGNIINEHLY